MTTQRAREFVVWRSGNAVGWDCSFTDIANETGLSIVGVRSICMRRGWDKRMPRERRGTNIQGERMPVDKLMCNPYLQAHGHV